MGWVHDVPGDDLYDHEGYCVAVLADGSEPEPVQEELGNGATSGNSSWWLYDGTKGRPRAAAVRAGCACGWRSSATFEVDFDDQEATEGFEYNDGPWLAWQQQHINHLLGSQIPLELQDALDTVDRMLTGLTSTRPLAVLAAVWRLEKLAQQAPEAASAPTARGAPRATNPWRSGR
jgi:hypothetical protein